MTTDGDASGTDSERFFQVVMRPLGYGPADCDPSARLVEDLAFDSLSFLEIEGLFAELAGHNIPDEVMLNLETVEDLLHMYGVYRDRRTGRS